MSSSPRQEKGKPGDSVANPIVLPTDGSPPSPDENATERAILGLKLNDDEKRPTGRQWLNDKTMTAFQNLLQQTFPHMEGLQDVLRQRVRSGYHCVPSSSAFVQVLHVGECHWVTVSNVDCSEGVVRWYDGLHGNPSNADVNHIAAMLNCSGNKLQVEIMNVQRQRGANDCGLSHWPLRRLSATETTRRPARTINYR